MGTIQHVCAPTLAAGVGSEQKSGRINGMLHLSTAPVQGSAERRGGGYFYCSPSAVSGVAVGEARLSAGELCVLVLQGCCLKKL